MFRAVVRGTFLCFEEDTEASPLPGTPARRSRSAGARLEGNHNFEDEGCVAGSVQRLTGVLRNDPASMSELVAPLPAAAGGTGVRELRELQLKLLRVLQPRERAVPASSPPTACGKLPKVTSIGSVCTMVPEEDADTMSGHVRPSLRTSDSSNSVSSMVSDWPRSSLRNVGSSNSISSMVSESGEESRSQRFGREQVLSAPPTPKDYCHGQVPKRCNLAKEFADTGHSGPPTTMMIRNIPNHYTQSHMVRELETLGFNSTYDFLYVPIDKGTLGSVGYCFVNFVNSAWASRCVQVFNNRPFERTRRDRRGKVAMVSVAHLQGLEANLRHYKDTAVVGSAQPGKGNGPMIVASLARSLS